MAVFANSADPETACKEDPHSLPLIFDWNSYLQQRIYPNSEIEVSISETQGWKG